MSDHDKKTLIDLLPPGGATKAGKTINLRNRYTRLKVENIGTGIKLPPFREWAKMQAKKQTEKQK